MASCSISFPDLSWGFSAGKLKVGAPRMRGLLQCGAKLPQLQDGTGRGDS